MTVSGRLGLDDPVDAVPGVGPKTAAKLDRSFGIETVRDLIEHYPRGHRDLGEVVDLGQVTVGAPATLIGRIVGWETKRTRTRKGGRRLVITEGTVEASGGGTFAVTFFNQPWRERQLRRGTVAAFSGKVERFRGDLKLSVPQVQILHGTDEEGLEHDRMLSVYPGTSELPPWRIREHVDAALEELPPFEDYLSEELLDRHDLLTLDDAIRGYHAPPDRPTARAARKRLVFDELFTLQLGLQWRRAHLEAELAGKDNHPHEHGSSLISRFVSSLPFEPTSAQERAFDEIGADLASERPMHRLLQGDVGAGKTLVATWAMLCAVDNGRQAALMAPTEVLAEQHHRTLLAQLEPLGVNMMDGIRVEVLTSSSTTSERRRILSGLLTGEVGIVVGTHALLEEEVRFADLGVVVIDEQHRFGVSQRVRLKEKGEQESGPGPAAMPDVLVMTATPIPRSLALTLYGDLDVTVLDELPPGRRPIVTQLITPRERDRRDRLYDFVREQAAQGLQTYVVCPLVEDSEEIAARNATDEHARLVERFPDLEVELVHGRMRSDEKDAAMQRFRSGEADVLVATTVIEVGVDVPQATIMVIEDAERFGISQLHQLRGRVGRGGDKSYCVLFAGWHGEITDEARERLDAVAATTDGFELAEKDLEIRGEGQLFGQRQSGLPDLKIARLQRDIGLIGTTRGEAERIIADDPHLLGHPSLRAEVLRRYEGGLEEFAALETG
ncbi:MAG: ATP-dependent DNA helicase RecG [Nitriliruptorales bacterium]|nr:ATP-dependent DNA helicase RecG [Nitriliruptorales bacterium]